MSFIVVEERADLIVGMGELAQGEIARLYVDPSFQRCGIGAAILRRVEDGARGAGLMTLAVRSSRQARSFYVAFGYAPLGEREQRIGAATFRWIDMVKRLETLGPP
jgi:GNAT superfamily N-acetyltransferase